MAMLPINASRKEKHAVVRLLWAKGLSASAIRAEMHPVYSDKCFARSMIERWLQKIFRRPRKHSGSMTGGQVDVLLQLTKELSNRSTHSYGQIVAFQYPTSFEAQEFRDVQRIKLYTMI